MTVVGREQGERPGRTPAVLSKTRATIYKVFISQLDRDYKGQLVMKVLELGWRERFRQNRISRLDRDYIEQLVM
jgi:hypothetical protein